MVYGDRGTASYAIAAEKAPFFVTDVGPKRLAMSELVQPPPVWLPIGATPPQPTRRPVQATFTVTGAGFNGSTIVEFVRRSGSRPRRRSAVGE